MKFVLLLWLTPFNVPTAYIEGGLVAIPFETIALCENELARVKKAAVHINGLCLMTSNPS